MRKFLNRSINPRSARSRWRVPFIFAAVVFSIDSSAAFKCWGLSGTEGASFLDIPVGGRPAALGGAYSALATDAYAPVWNPAGLGALRSTQLSTMHLSYLEGISYEYLSFVHPWSAGQSLGAAVQYLRPGSISETDATGHVTGDFSGYYAAYSLAYGRALTPDLSIGTTGKVISAKISDVSAQAYAADLGSLYKAREDLTVAAVVSNLGTKLSFLGTGNALPLALRLGASYQAREYLNVAAEGIYSRTGLPGFRTGLELRLSPMAFLRAGYRTETIRESSGLAGLTTGIGLELWGQKFDYAWVPLADLGNTQYFSLVIQFNGWGEKGP